MSDTNGTVKRPQLFEVVTVYHPKATKEQREAGDVPKSMIIDGVPKLVLAHSDELALVSVARAVPDAYADKMEDVQIYIRPFSGDGVTTR